MGAPALRLSGPVTLSRLAIASASGLSARRWTWLAYALVASSLVAPASAGAIGWGTPVPIPGSVGGSGASVQFDAAARGIAQFSGKTSLSPDGGASWAFPVNGAPVVGIDAAGNRVWVSGKGTTAVRVLRTGPGGAPNGAGAKFIPTANSVAVEDVGVAVNPAGDALVVWTTSNVANNASAAYAAFWPVGAADLNPPQQLGPGSSSAYYPTPVLEPSRRAEVVWIQPGVQPGSVLKVSALDASAPSPFGGAVQIGGSNPGPLRGAQAPDGRAVVEWPEIVPIPPNSNGATETVVLRAVSRGPGQDFGAAQTVAGTPDRTLHSFGTSLAMSPTGRVIIGFHTSVNRPSGRTCDQNFGEVHTEVAQGNVSATGTLSVTNQNLGGDGAAFSEVPAVAAGPDGRLAAVWKQTDTCYHGAPPYPHITYFASLGGSDGVLSPIQAPPAEPAGGLAFRPDGWLYALTVDPQPSGSPALAGVAYDTGIPVSTPPTPEPTGPTPDTIPPDTAIVSGPTGSIAIASAAFAFSSSETGSSFQCKLDGGDFAACGSPKNYASLADGPHTFSVKATDSAGNTDASPAARTFTVTAASCKKAKASLKKAKASLKKAKASNDAAKIKKAKAKVKKAKAKVNKVC